MVYSRRYARLFVPLIQDTSDYNIGSRACIGQGVIEIRNGNGKINISIQGLKSNKAYKAVLAGENVFSSLGIISVDNTGKGNCKYTFDPDNIENKKIEQFDTLAITIEENNSLRTLLIGHTSKVVNRKIGININAVKNNYELMNESVNENVDNYDQNEPNFDKKTAEFDNCQQNGVDMFTTDESEEKSTNSNSDNSVDNSVDNVDNNSKENIDLNSVVSEFKKNVLELEHYTFLKKEEIEGIRNKNERVLSDMEIIRSRLPFNCSVTIDEKPVKWYPITPGELGIIDESLYPLSFSLFLTACYCRDNSLLYGVYTENGWEKQAIAIPAKDKLYESQAKRFGCDKYDNGYWLYFL